VREQIPPAASASTPSWLEPVCRIPLDFRAGGKSVRQLFTESDPDLSDRSRFIDLVAGRLRKDPALVEAWQDYSLNKRVDEGPYLEGSKVGYYARGERLDKRTHAKPAMACADFIFREAESVLRDQSPLSG
jgi:hypothetical protein